MRGPFWHGLLAGLVVYFVLIAAAAVVIDAATSALTSRDRAFVVASLLAAVVAGLVGARWARRAERRLRVLAATSGPTVIAIVFALTSTATDSLGRWLPLVVSVAGAALGAVLRDRLS